MPSSIKIAKEFLKTAHDYPVYTEALLRAAKCGHTSTIWAFLSMGADVRVHGDLALCMAGDCSDLYAGRAIAAMLDGCGADWSNAVKSARLAEREDIAKRLERLGTRNLPESCLA
jgi:hypothetical protein